MNECLTLKKNCKELNEGLELLRNIAQNLG